MQSNEWLRRNAVVFLTGLQGGGSVPQAVGAISEPRNFVVEFRGLGVGRSCVAANVSVAA